ncbi:MAG: hypothetical protein IKX44_05375 [Prevotella sp.]|nr:hypothetical protein [Prevotella sp.]
MQQTIDISKFYLIRKESIVKFLFYAGVLTAYFCSLNAWFLWPIVPYYPVIAGFFFLAAMYVAGTMSESVFKRSDFIIPLFAFVLLGFYQRLVNGDNFNGFVTTFFHAICFYALFRYDVTLLNKVATFLAKTMAMLLVVSIPMFVLYILGFPLPYRDLQYQDAFYTFSNYFFFLIDDRQLLVFIPRFQAVFLEPAHLATAIAVLLLAQRGKWRKWYNIVLLTGLLISFSLGGYVYLVVVMFLNQWINRKKFLAKVIVTSVVIAAVVTGSFFYNQGENLIHQLIVLRLEIDDGEMAGNQRTTVGFDADFENFLSSSDILFGREKENTFGDSGYKVFIYDYGFVGTFLLLLFYVAAVYKARNKRAMLAALFIALLIFGVDAFLLWYNRFIPLYCAAYSDELPPVESEPQPLIDYAEPVT